MKVGIISDTHIPASGKKLPGAMVDQLKGIDLIIHAGDLTEIPVLDELNRIAHTEAVVGNMDSFKVRKVLPEKKILELKDFRIGIIHGQGHSSNLISYAEEKFKGEKLNCIVYGHSHTPSINYIADTMYFNPGSPTDKIFAPYNSFGILEIGKKLIPKIVRL